MKILDLISELKYSREIHLQYARSSKESKQKQRHYRVARQKQLVIEALRNKSKEDQITLIRVLKRWIKVHQLWINYLDCEKHNPSKYKSQAKKNGDPSWHKRWIDVYTAVLEVI